MGVLVLVIGLTLRIAASFGAVSFGDMTLQERFFVALAWSLNYVITLTRSTKLDSNNNTNRLYHGSQT
jgi:hypothetical protein